MKKTTSILLIIVAFLLVQVQFGFCLDKEKTSPSDLRINNQGQDIVLVLDNSGSMKKNDPKFLARNVVTNLLMRVNEGSRLGMVIFDQKVELVESLMGIKDPEVKKNFLRSLSKVNYRGQFSNSPAAIERAIYELRTRGKKDAQKIIILLTDGIVDTGDKLKDLDGKRWLKNDLARESKRAGIQIVGISFTNGADYSLIQTLALKTDGDYFRAYGADDIKGLLRKIDDLPRIPGEHAVIPALGKVKKAKLKPVTVKATALVPSIAGKAKPTTPEVKSVTTTPPKIQARVAPVRAAPAPQKENIFMSLILSAMVVFLVIVIAILAFYKARLKPEVKVEEVADQPVQPRREVPALPQAMLVDVKNVTSKKTMTLIKENITIGRGSNNDLSIQKDTVSGFHATIQYKDGTFFLEDQRSKNKTLLNGKEIDAYSPERLKSGDEITFTEYKFIFLIAYQTPSGETLVWREN